MRVKEKDWKIWVTLCGQYVRSPGLAQSSSTAEFVQGGLSSVSDAMGFWGRKRNDEKANEINRELDSVMKEGGSGGGNDSGGGSGGGCSGSF